jgi:hypothetical protein
VDVLLYRLVERGFDQLKRDHGVEGLHEHILPLIDQAIRGVLPSTNLIPQEVAGIVEFFRINRDRIGGFE